MRKFTGLKTAAGALVLLAATAIVLPAQTFTTLGSFDNKDGAFPTGLVQATDGSLYGTTSFGGASGDGVIFKITLSGTLTTLHSFESTDGVEPFAELVQATDGNFYGTTEFGGANAEGTVFKITPSGKLTTLYSFCSQSGCTDGYAPSAALVQATGGNFYGTTYYGGNLTCVGGCGTVFKITPSGTLKTLHSFHLADGATPEAALVQANDGNFYGTTSVGGASGDGAVFKITPSGTLTTLHSFDFADGATPQAALVQANDGSLYGTTPDGGAYSDGTIFKITPSGTLTMLYSFCSKSGCTDGAVPTAAMVQATDGNFYGTTFNGGAYNDGTIFKVTQSGKLTTLHSFDGTDGFNPFAALVQDTNGDFYGTTFYGGPNSYGTIFSLSVGLGPFVKTQTTSGKVGAAVKILGTSLTGATSVTFNGIPAVFKVFSSSLIGAKVPAGATTGTVQVVTPGGTLSSNVPFRVTQ